MNIIWDQATAQKLRGAHTVLELETFEVKGAPITTYCVVPAEKIGLSELANLEQNKLLHASFVEAFKTQNVALCTDLARVLTGKFGGELDTFYEEILKRIR
jgi:hypothetical protein